MTYRANLAALLVGVAALFTAAQASATTDFLINQPGIDGPVATAGDVHTQSSLLHRLGLDG